MSEDARAELIVRREIARKCMGRYACAMPVPSHEHDDNGCGACVMEQRIAEALRDAEQRGRGAGLEQAREENETHEQGHYGESGSELHCRRCRDEIRAAERGERDGMEMAARVAEEHTEHMDFTDPQDHIEPPYRCNVAQAIRAAVRALSTEGPPAKDRT